MSALASDMLRLAIDTGNKIERNLTRGNILIFSTKFVFFGLLRKQRWSSSCIIGLDIFDFFSAKQNSIKLQKRQDIKVLYQGFFRAVRKKKKDTLSSDWLRQFLFLL